MRTTLRERLESSKAIVKVRHFIMSEKVGLAQVWKKCVRKHVELGLEGKLGGQRESRG